MRGWKELYGVKLELDIYQLELMGFNMYKQIETYILYISIGSQPIFFLSHS